MKEGLPASLTFKMVVPDLNDAVVTRAGVEQETALNQLMFLFYKKSDTSKPALQGLSTSWANIQSAVIVKMNPTVSIR